ncbi:MAG: hypothetical protein AAFX06_32830, partial [Planctomycetota bacterium]
MKSCQANDGGAERAQSARSAIQQLVDEELRDLAEHLVVIALPDDESEERADRDQVSHALETRSVTELESVFTAVAEELGPHLAHAWKSLAALPKVSIGQSVPARFPNHPAATSTVRFTWLSEILRILYRFPIGKVKPEWLAVHGGGLTEETAAEMLLRIFEYSTDGSREQDTVGRLLGSVIAAGGHVAENVYDTLVMIARDDHPVGQTGGHVYRGLWLSGRQEAFDILGERLRESEDEAEVESIVRACVEGGPEAIQTTLRHVMSLSLLDQDPIASAVGSWFGLDLCQAVADARPELIEPFIASLERHLSQPTPDFEPHESEGATGYIELLTEMFFDAAGVPKRALAWLDRVEEDEISLIARAFRVVQFPSEMDPALEEVWLRVLDTEDIQVAALAIWWNGDYPPVTDPIRLFEIIERVKARLKGHRGRLSDEESQTASEAKRKLLEMVASVAGAIPIATLLPYASDAQKAGAPYNRFRDRLLSIAGPDERELVVAFLKRNKNFDAHSILPGLIRESLSTDDLAWLQPYIEAKHSYQRPEGANAIAQHASETETRNFVEALLADKKKQLRLGGFHILRALVEREKDVHWVASTAAELGTRKKLTNDEKHALQALSKSLPADVIADLHGKSEASPPSSVQPATKKPQRIELRADRDAMVACWDRIASLVEHHAETMVRFREEDSHDVQSGTLIEVDLRDAVILGYREDAELNRDFPLADIWQTWFESKDNRELHDSNVLAGLLMASWSPEFSDTYVGYDSRVWLGDDRRRAKNYDCVAAVVQWLAIRNANESGAMLLLDAFEYSLASMPDWKELVDPHASRCRSINNRALPWVRALQEYALGFDAQIPADVVTRWWRLACFHDRPLLDVPRLPPSAELAAAAFGVGEIDEQALKDCWHCPTQGDTPIEITTSLEDNHRARVKRYAGDRSEAFDRVLDQFLTETVQTALDDDSPRQTDAMSVASMFGSYP